jgi:pyruvate dehydrogenase E2 component (dihydrolipoamide acetyltransferase)
VAKFYEMPAVSPTMEVGTIVAWRIAEGQAFASGAVVAEVGTDKANMEAEIFDAGVMLKHLVAEGDEVPAGYPIAIWGAVVGEDFSALLAEFETRKATKSAPAAVAEPASTPAPAPEAKPEPVAAAPIAAPPTAVAQERTWQGRTLSLNFMEPPGDIRFGSGPSAAPRVNASPLARKVAADLGVDLRRVQGTGPGGRINREDVEKAPVARGPSRGAPRAEEAVKNTPMRKTIAKRLLASHQDIPTFFLTVTLHMQAFVDLRAALKKRSPDLKVSYNDMLVACVARALRESPKVNAAWNDTSITRFGRVDIGIAVAMPDGLITPVLRDADQLSFVEIGEQVRALAGRARDQKLKPEEYTGSTFTISNLGMYDIDHFTAIINPPEAAILAVGSIAQVPVVENGQLSVGWRMKCTMTCDHRVIDGATGAEFLQVLRHYVESPALLLL